MRTIEKKVLSAFDIAGRMALQPIVSLGINSPEPYAYEALFRPYQYDIQTALSIVRSTNTLFQFDFNCRKLAFDAISRKHRESVSRKFESALFVNICSETLLNPHHTPGITDHLAVQCGWDQSKTVLEISESTAIINYDLFLHTIGHYRRQGYKIAIDDFGSGYAGFKMFSLVRPDYLKIDKHFIHNIDENPVNRKIVESITGLCREFGIITIAEGLETPGEVEVVKEIGVDLGQGFILGRPEIAG